MKVTITHPASPHCGREALVTRVCRGEHVDLVVTLEGGGRITVDSTWTDYWVRKGEQPPTPRMIGLAQARELTELLGRLEGQSRAMEVPED